MARWRRLFAAAGEDPLFVMAQSFGDRDPRQFGMDAAVEFPPHKLTDTCRSSTPSLTMLDHAATRGSSTTTWWRRRRTCRGGRFR